MQFLSKRLTIFVLLSLCLSARGQSLQYLRDVTLPVGGGTFQKPGGVYYDWRAEELYVAETAGNSIAIFDKQGNFEFSFTDNKHLIGPDNLAVDYDGKIYVLSETRHNYLSVFDYNGVYLRDLVLKDTVTGTPLEISSFVIDAQDHLYVLSCSPAQVNAFTTDGQSLNSFPLFGELDKATREQPILGRLALINGDLIIPMPMIAQIARYSCTGKFVGVFGLPGGGPTQLAHPVAAASDGKGGILVLDQLRHTILQYKDDGSFVQEFGGMGAGNGWFYNPIALAGNGEGECFVAQFFQNRVQALAFSTADNGTNDDHFSVNEAKKAAPGAPSDPK